MPGCKKNTVGYFFEIFGDGTIYFMIKKEDLAKGNFDAVQVVVQNT
jgi:uncharacterized protein YwqG